MMCWDGNVDTSYGCGCATQRVVHTWVVHVVEDCERHPLVGLGLHSPVNVAAAGLLASGEVHVAGEVAPFAEVNTAGPPAVSLFLNATCGAFLVAQPRELAAAGPVVVTVEPHPVGEGGAAEGLGEPDREQHSALIRAHAACTKKKLFA